jgi:amino acid adenylation domain-containing protein
VTAGSTDRGDEALLVRLLAREGFAVDGASVLARRPSREPAPAGPAQRRFWIQERVEGTSGLNNLGCLLRFGAAIDRSALERAVAVLVERHEALRTRFEETAGDIFEIVEASAPASLHWVEAEAGDEAAARAFIEQPFRLDEAPLWRAALFADPFDADALLLCFHHAIMDWSGVRQLVDELNALYAAELTGAPAGLPAGPLQQADYCHWLRGEARQAQVGRDRDYWRDRLAGQAPPLELPAAAPRGRTEGKRCRMVPVGLDDALVAAVRRFAMERRTTVFMVLLTAYASVLGRFALADDVSVGTAVDNRDGPATDTIVGCLTDMMALRCDLSGEPSFGALVQRIHAASATDLEHKSLGFAELVELIKPERRVGVTPLFQAIFNLLPDSSRRDASARLTPIPPAIARADLALELQDDGARISGRLEYRVGLIPPTVAEAIGTALVCLLRHGLSAPDRPFTLLPLLETRAAEALLARLNPPLPEPPGETLAGLFVARAARQPGDVAVIEGARRITFGELLDRSTALAEQLIERGLRPERTVAVCLERSIDLAVALVAVVRAGAAVLPLDPAYPEPRLAQILADSAAPFLIARAAPSWLPEDSACALLVPELRGSKGIPLPRVRPQDAAYLVYTSGSTGRPKGVVGLHRGTVNRLRWMWQAFPFEPGEVSCQKTSTAFGDFVWEFFGPLLAGVPSVIADDATTRDPRALTALIRDKRVSRIVLVPSLLRAWLDTLPDLSERLVTLRVCTSSGEALPLDLARRFRAALPACRLLNLYGSSEVSADATWHEVDGRETGRIPIGRPIPGNRIAVVDQAGQVLPVGAPGEIVVGGLGVARGYLNDPEATAARFGAFGPGDPNEARFRSGDVGFWDAEGELVYLGRRDRQVKVSGVRIEPGEIEAALARHPGVRASHVIAPAGAAAGSTSLVAYLTGDSSLTSEQLRAFLSRRLPRALVPESFVLLDSLPLNPNGKIDVARLPAPASVVMAQTGRHAVLDPIEALAAEVWASVLDRPVASGEADFFALGGSSLQAILTMARLGEALGRSLPVAMLFETPRLADLAQRLNAASDEEEDALPAPLPKPGAGPAPATTNQVWLWEEYRRDPTRIAYNLAIAYRLDGSLDTAALDAALAELVARHEALRTRLAPGDHGLIQVVEAAPSAPLRLNDLSSAADPEAALQARIADLSRHPFALDRDLPFRAYLARLGDTHHCLILVMHHVACDGWSGQILVDELSALYRARREGTVPPSAPRLQCGDVARWQQRMRPLLARRLESYRESLAGAETPRPAGLRAQADSGGPVAVEAVVVDRAALDRFYRLGKAGHATPFMMMLAAWAALLARFGDCERPLLATPLAGRSVPGLQSVVGFLANPILLSVDLRDSPAFEQIVEAAREGLLAGLRHQEIPLAWIQASGDGWPVGDRGDALRTMLIVEDARAWDLAIPGLTARLLGTPQSPEARVDLALLVTETHDGPEIRIEYATRRVPPRLARRLARGLAALIRGATANPATPLDRLPLLEEGDAPAIVSAASAPRPAAQRIDDLLAIRATASPEATAVTDGRTSLSYAALQRHAEGLAGRLRALGIGRGDRVALVAAPSPRQLAGLIGILRIGAVVVPLDPAYPRARIAATLADAAVAAAIADVPLDYPCPQLRLDDSASGDHRASDHSGDAPAAVIYTSGTSGQPKGVLVAHDALCRLGAALAEAYALGPADRVLQVVSPAFDVALSDIVMTLSAGAALVVPPRDAVIPGSSLVATLETLAVTHLQAPAAILAATAPGDLPALRVVAVGGEVCPPETARRWAAGRRLFVAYGPSEATVTAALAEYDGAGHASTIGRPFCGARLMVLDPAGAPVPVGVPGELSIAGANVALGYLGHPGLTASRFLPDPDGGPGARRYRTGDRVRLEDDGTSIFLGRLDRQVKLRGFRIEPGETEAALMSRPGVARALAAVRSDALGERRLVAWVVPAPGARLDSARLRRELRQILPDHLVPAMVSEIAEVPLTRNGKIDWAALPEPMAQTAAGRPKTIHAIAGRSALGDAAIRRDLAALWTTLLDRPEIGLDDNFFDIGGHSLLVVRLQERLAESFGVELPIGELFGHPTLRSLAGRLQRALPDARTAEEIEDFTL